MPDPVEENSVLSKAAYDRLKAELEELTTVRRPEIAEKIRRAREHGDIRENAEYDAAKDEQGMLESRIRTVEHIIKTAEVVEAPTTADEVGPGMIVHLRADDDPGGEPEIYLVAASSEERAAGARTVSLRSPLGQALLGHKPGDRIVYEAPGGAFGYEVVKLEPWDGG